MNEDRRKAEELQDAVVNHPHACYVEACPGAGKTQTLVRRVVRQLPLLPMRHGIAVLSFTNSAVDEFTERFTAETASTLTFPHFVGTFDAFLNHFIVLPHGLIGCQARPVIVDAWHDIEIRHGIAGVSAGPIVLKKFDADGRLTGRDFANLGKEQQGCKDGYEAAAKRRLQGLARKGMIDVAAARRLVLERLKNAEYAVALGDAIAARFQEIIVDEAQDCNDEDVAILTWLQRHGVPLVLVCDPDQAIYGFRKGVATAFGTFAATFPKLELKGNFRSSKIICAAAATLRGRPQPDLAVGDHRDADHPVWIVTYKQSVEAKAAVAKAFTELVTRLEIDPAKSVVLAHRRAMAERVAANPPQSIGGTSRLGWLAGCVAGYHAEGASGRQREQSIRSLIKLLMDIENVPVDERAALHQLKDTAREREYFRKAIEVLEALPPVCVVPDAVKAWVAAAEAVLLRVTGLKVRLAVGKGKWSNPLSPRPVSGTRYATVHEAKGKAYDAVCVVIDTEREKHGLLEEWKARSSASSEALRVLYVAMTRARKLMVLAVQEKDYVIVHELLSAANVPLAGTPPQVKVRKGRKTTK